jgi:predicted MFS family arabinose efflux permease
LGRICPALADQIGSGESDEFGWKQIVGVVIGVAIVVFGIIIATLAEKPANGVGTQMERSTAPVERSVWSNSAVADPRPRGVTPLLGSLRRSHGRV